MQVINDWEYNPGKGFSSGPWDNAEDAWDIARKMKFHRDAWMYDTQITRRRDGKYMVYFRRNEEIISILGD